MKACISEVAFGRLDNGLEVKKYCLRNNKGTEAIFTNLGAAWIGFHLRGEEPSLVLGCETLEAFANQGAHLGATVGRYANRINLGRFQIDGKTYQVETNQPPHHLHGGTDSFTHQLWDSHITLENDTLPVLTFRHHSPSGDAGFPGNLDVTVRISLDDNDNVSFEYSAKTDQTTVINLTNHAYFNLAGEQAGSLAGHDVRVHSRRFVQTGADGIPTGELTDVSDTALDLTEWSDFAAPLATMTDPTLKQTNGFDQCYCFATERKLTTLAQARHIGRGIELTCQSDLPGMQLYSGNYLGGTPINDQQCYPSYSGFCFEPGFWTDSPNHAHFPNCVIDPDNGYSAIITYSFKKLDENK